MQYKNFCVRINQNVEGFKFGIVKEQSYLSGNIVNSCYFKLSKTQGETEYRKYLKKLIPQVLTNSFGLKLDIVTVAFENEAFC